MPKALYKSGMRFWIYDTWCNIGSGGGFDSSERYMRTLLSPSIEKNEREILKNQRHAYFEADCTLVNCILKVCLEVVLKFEGSTC